MHTYNNTDSTENLRGSNGDVFREDCPAREMLDVLASKWTLLILHALGKGPARTGALRRKIEGISEKMLLQTLKELEHYSLVTRTVFTLKPLHVEYELTHKGQSLCSIVKSLDAWVEDHAGSHNS